MSPAVFGRGGDDHAIGIGDQDLPAAPRWCAACAPVEFGLHAPPDGGAVALARTFQPLRQHFGDGLDVLCGVRQRAAAMVEHLHEGADRDGDQEGDDEGGNRAPQSGLRGEEASVSGLRDRLRQSLDGIGTRRRVRCLGARHELPPCRIVAALTQP